MRKEKCEWPKETPLFPREQRKRSDYFRKLERLNRKKEGEWGKKRKKKRVKGNQKRRQSE